jgi:hypothetical protein
MPKQEVLALELARWAELFAETDESTRKAADGLIQKAAFLHAMCVELEQTIEASGTIKIHPDHPELQKQVPAVKEYARLSESYANLANKLNTLRLKTAEEDDDELDEYE